MVKSGIKERNYSYVIPGTSTTQVQAQSNTTARATAYGTSNYAQAYGSSSTNGTATAKTTYTPSRVVSGTDYLPYASGLVLRYLPGAEAYRQGVLSLDDAALEEFLREADRIWQDPSLSFELAHALRLQLLREYQGITVGDEAATPFTGRNSGIGRRTQTFDEWAASRPAGGS